MDQETLHARRRLAEEIGAPKLRIICVDDRDSDVLRLKAKPVRHVNRRIRQLLDSLAVTMYAADGVGLAAPQVGVSQRVVVVDAGDGLIELVNPEVVDGSGEQTGMEGCLSIPGFTGEVARADRVRIRGLDREGREHWVEGEGYLARALLHELDHLDGVLFTDRATRVVELAPESRLRVAYFGTPGFAAVAMRELLEADVEPVVIVTRPDAPVGRGLEVQPSAVHDVGKAAGIPVLTPPRPKGRQFVDELRAFDLDAIVLVAYGQILPPEVLALPRLGAINVHPSLLPRWRGAAPVQRALMAGDATTGVTIMYMADELDAGDIILQKEVPVGPEDDAGSLSVKLAHAGGELIVETLRALTRGEATRTPQDGSKATYAAKLTPEDEVLQWDRPSRLVLGQIRGLAPRPGARTTVHGEMVKVLRATLSASPHDGAPGTVIELGEQGIVVATADGAVAVTQVQPAGKRSMSARDFVNGSRLQVGERL
ncbi:MAG TPA: methionyl-tRNA formyltransferase [Bacillota bacterium]|nr:methionyl-tRNA formyltransferase [Bacillota bacterium]